MSKELKPCPFCGEIPYSTNIQTWCVNDTCPLYYTEMDNIIWNARPIEGALRADLTRKDAEIKALEELVESLEAETDAIESYGDLHCDLNEDQPECKKLLTKLTIARRRTTQTRARLAEVRGEQVKPCPK